MPIRRTAAAVDQASNRRATLVITTVAGFLTPFTASSIVVALPSIGAELKMDAILLGWVATAFLLAAAVLLVPFGRLADIHGRKRIFTYGLYTYTISSIILALSNSAAMLIAFRALQGVGAALLFSTAAAIVTSVFPIGERGRILGINAAVVYAAFSIGALVGGLLTQYLGWRSIFWVSVFLGLVAIALTLWKLKGEWAEARGETFDIVGSVIYGLALIAIIYGLSVLPEVSGGVLILAGVLALVGFFFWENRAKHPVLEISLLRHNSVFAFSNLAALFSYSATFAVTFLLSLYLQYIKGLTPETAGIVLVTSPLMQVIISPLAGRLSDRVEPRILASAGMALTAIGLVFFIFLQPRTSLWFILTGLFILGLGFGLFSSPNINAVMSSVETRHYGVGSAMLATMRQTGMMFSMAIVMLVFAIYIGRVEITAEYYPQFMRSTDVLFIIFAVLCFAGIFASLARGKLR